MTEDKLVKADVVADYLGVPISWVREHTRGGRVPHYPMGRYVRYDLSEVRAWVAEQKQGGAAWGKHEPNKAAA